MLIFVNFLVYNVYISIFNKIYLNGEIIMKKFKRILTAITTTAISAAWLCSMFSASADTTQLKTFRIFHEVGSQFKI